LGKKSWFLWGEHNQREELKHELEEIQQEWIQPRDEDELARGLAVQAE
jgi:hypothetical protein